MTDNRTITAHQVANKAFCEGFLTKALAKKAKANNVVIVRISDKQCFGALSKVLNQKEFEHAQKKALVKVTGVKDLDNNKASFLFVRI
jgi:hypothetical protein